MAQREYHRLTHARPRTKFALVSTGRSSLWLGKDHLLCIDSTGYTETYKRFYFRDIQAIIICKTDRYKYVSLISAVFAALSFFPLALTGEIVIKYVLGALGGFFLLVLFINLALGPSASCQLRTAVQLEDLPSLPRLRLARKVLHRLRPLIVAAQGELRPEDIPLRFQEWSGQNRQVEPEVAETPRPAVDNPEAPPQTA